MQEGRRPRIIWGKNPIARKNNPFYFIGKSIPIRIDRESKTNYEKKIHDVDGSRVVNRKRRYSATDDDDDNHDDDSSRACME